MPHLLPHNFSIFQSTFPHGERRRQSAFSSRMVHVSIHVPARGTTCRMPQTSKDLLVSIHVPARGTTRLSLLQIIRRIWFQSTFPHGERRSNPGFQRTALEVSIHVPARGTTRKIIDLVVDALFQSTFPHGERQGILEHVTGSYMFQSTFPHGERRFYKSRASFKCRFNPRSRTGNDFQSG